MKSYTQHITILMELQNLRRKMVHSIDVPSVYKPNYANVHEEQIVLAKPPNLNVHKQQIVLAKPPNLIKALLWTMASLNRNPKTPVVLLVSLDSVEKHATFLQYVITAMNSKLPLASPRPHLCHGSKPTFTETQTQLCKTNTLCSIKAS
jgi:hypothetical protein